MAAAKGKGILSTPPTRVSPGVYRDAKGNLSTGKTAAKAGKNADKKEAKGQKKIAKQLAKETKVGEQNQQRVINQNVGNDLGLTQQAGAMMPAIQDAYSQPFDYNQGPAAPVGEDYNAFIDKQMSNYNSAFDKRMNPQFQQQNEDFEQQMANRGIPMGSELYNREKSRIEQSQNDARTQAYASGQSAAMDAAGRYFDVGTQAHQNNIAERLDARGRPLNEYGQLMGAQSGYSQQMGLQNDTQAHDRWMMQHTPRGGGGGGGGGGAGAMWQQYGFSSPQEYDAYKISMQRDQALWEQQNGPKQPKAPSPYLGLAGNILGSAASGYFGSDGFWK